MESKDQEKEIQFTPEDITRWMMEGDYFSQWLGIEVLETGLGKSRLLMRVRGDMLNGFSILHGGVSYAFADSALAFASNSYGIIGVSTSVNMAYPLPAKEGDILTASASELSRTRRTAIYDITVTNQNGERVGLMRGTVYLTGKPHTLSQR